MAKQLWVSAEGTESWEKRKGNVTAALEAGADAIVVNSGEGAKAKQLGKIKVIGEDVQAKFIEIKNKEDELRAAKEACSGTVVVSTTDWKVIPLENLIAAKQKKSGTLIARVSSVGDAKLALEALEIGVDGVLFDGKASDIKRVKELIEKMNRGLAGHYRCEEPLPGQSLSRAPILPSKAIKA